MKIIVDTADLGEIREAFSWGIVDGVTTNPSLIKKAAKKLQEESPDTDIADYIEQILETARGCDVSLEVIGTSEAEMYEQGMFLYERFNPVAGNVIVKVPVNPNLGNGVEGSFDGLKTIKRLADNGIPINTTLVFTPEQALLAAKAGARYVSPFAGRVDDDLRKQSGEPFDKTDYYPQAGEGDYHDNGIVSGVDLVAECVEILAAFGYECGVLAASLRNSRQVRECALVGADLATMPFSVLRSMIEHKQTIAGMRAFTDDIVPEYAALFDN
ncbi:MAG: transaldolase family protein [Myxococcota bacterium]